MPSKRVTYGARLAVRWVICTGSPSVPCRNRSRFLRQDPPRLVQVDAVFSAIASVSCSRGWTSNPPRRTACITDRASGRGPTAQDRSPSGSPGRAVLARAVRELKEDPRLQLDKRRSQPGRRSENVNNVPRRPSRLLRRRPHPAPPWRGRARRGAAVTPGLAVTRRRTRRPADYLDLHQPVREAHRRLDRVGQPAVVAHDEAIDDGRDVVLVALVEDDLVLEHAGPPSILARLKPSPHAPPVAAYFPCAPRTTGAITMKRVPSASSITWSTSAPPTYYDRRPQIGQWGLPTRAHSRRR